MRTAEKIGSLHYDKLWDNASRVLAKNWNDKYQITIPAHKLYPYQWSWDSAFIAIGNSYLDTDKAMTEMRNLFSAQWKNGMVPHVVFYEPSDTYWPEPGYYQIERAHNWPKNVMTSGMTQPPVHAISCHYIYENAKSAGQESKAREFLKWIFPKLMAFHRYLLSERDPEHSGLATILHPWESGMDDSPIWDNVIENIVKEHKDELPEYKRKDVKAVDDRQGERPIADTYRTFIYLIKQMRESNYDEHLMYQKSPFKVKDVVFNSIFYVANKCLVELASALNGPDDEVKEIKGWMKRQKIGFDNFFKEYEPAERSYRYYDYDVIKSDRIRKVTSSCIVPIFTGMLDRKDVDSLVKMMRQNYFCGTGSCVTRLVPSYALDGQKFDTDRYWRGPFWININWMVYYGLLQHGYLQDARVIRDKIIELVDREGCREYYQPFTGDGLGGKDFSWTAALVLDLIYSYEHKTPIEKLITAKYGGKTDSGRRHSL